MDFFEITSQENNQIKLLKKLSSKKYQKEFNSFFVENLKTIIDALNDGFVFKEFYVTHAFLANNKKLVSGIVSRVHGAKKYVLKDSLNKVFSNLKTPSGICAIYDIKERKHKKNQSIIYLNGINDPGNLGSILRSALALGFENIVLDEHCASLYNFKTLTAIKDTIFKLNIERDNGFDKIKLIKNKMSVIVSTSNGKTDFREVAKNKPICVVFGNEANGVSDDIMEIADFKIGIKLFNNVESLNVVSASSIILYKINEQ